MSGFDPAGREGTWVAGQMVADKNGQVWHCTVSGAPGTWVPVETRYVQAGSLPFRRAGLPDPLPADALTTATITTTPTAGGSVTTIASGVVGSNISDGKVSLLGGSALHSDASEGVSPSLKFDWKNLTSGVPGFPFPFGMSIQFMVTGTQLIEFKVYAHTNYAWRLTVDGRRVTDLPVAAGLTANAQNTIKFDLGDANTHRIRLDLNSCAISRVYIGPAGTVWPMPARGPRWFGLGDSTMQGASAGTGQEADSWLLGFARLLGSDDVWNGAIGGTGPLSTNGGASGNYLTRVTTDVAPAAPAAVLLGGYYNDLIVNGLTASAIAVQYAAILDALAALNPNPTVVGLGSFDPLGVNGSNYTTVEAAVIPVFAAKGVAFISPITGNVYDSTGTLAASTGPWITSANKAAMISGDNVHQTDAGKRYTYSRAVEAVRLLASA